MAFTPRAATPQLRDKFGLWCAYCGGRTKSGSAAKTAPQRANNWHHVAQEWLTQGTDIDRPYPEGESPLTEYDWHQWVVPAHAECHRHLDAYSQSVATGIAGARTARLEQVAVAAAACYDKGDYALSVLLHQVMRARSRYDLRDSNQERAHLQFEFSAAAGLWFYHFVPWDRFIALLPERLRPTRRYSELYGSFLLNPQVTEAPSRELAGFIQGLYDSLPKRGGDVLRAKLARQLMIVKMEVAAAEEALEKSRDLAESHPVLTSHIGVAWANHLVGNYQLAVTPLKDPDFLHGAGYWHRALTLFSLGYFLIARRDWTTLDELLSTLIRAHHIACCKGLRGWAIPDPIRKGAVRTCRLTAGDLLAFVVNENNVTMERLDRVRAAALSPEWRGELWNPPHFPWPHNGASRTK